MPARARFPALLLVAGPAALLAGAWGFELLGGLAPCEMCWWQRWALIAALAVALLGVALGAAQRHGAPPAAVLALRLAAVAVLVGAAIAFFHAGVEQHWWAGFTRCTAPAVTGSSADVLADILAQPLVRCDAIPWSLFGLSMAGWNAAISTLLGGVALWRLR